MKGEAKKHRSMSSTATFLAVGKLAKNGEREPLAPAVSRGHVPCEGDLLMQQLIV